jgi:tetratricopeptide (TPR) repeat protein
MDATLDNFRREEDTLSIGAADLRFWLAMAFTAAALALCGCAGAVARPPEPRDAGALLARAQQDLAAGRAAEAQAGFEQALLHDARLYPALRGRVEAARLRGTLPHLLAELLANTQARPDDGPAWYSLGLARFAVGAPAPAIEALETAVRLLPAEADPQFRLGVALLDGGRPAEAKDPLARAVALAPGTPRYRVPYATCLDRLGDRKGAISALRDLPDLAPLPDEAALAVRAARAITDPFRGVPAEAREDLAQAFGYLDKDAPALAMPALERLTQRLPGLAAAHALLGLAAVRLDEAPKAIAELSRAAELSPEAPQPHVYLAELYAAKDRGEQAAAEYALALERNPLDVATLRKLGTLRLDRLAKPQEAVEPLARAAALLPGDDDVVLLLARAQVTGGKPEAGRALLAGLAARHPDQPGILLRLAAALSDERSLSPPARREALAGPIETLLSRVLALQPANVEAARLLAALRGS